MKRRKNGTFTSEGLRGNKFRLGKTGTRTTFRKGEQHTMKNHPSWKGGLQKAKDGYYVTVGTRKRVRRSRLVWEQVYGDLPDGYVIYHLDGDCYNDDINNLEAITRRELAMRNAHKRAIANGLR